jgi:tryptophan halogenase
MKTLIVGGGTAGLISAIILRKRLNYQVDVVYSGNIGIVGVGEGSTEHFRSFMEFVGIDAFDLISKCDSTFKSGIMFKNWGVDDYLHHVGVPYNSKYSQYAFVYANQISKNKNKLSSQFIWENKIPTWFLDNPQEFAYNQFHFNTYKLNEYLVDFAKKIGISFYDDEILDVVLDTKGNIKKLKGENREYKYDFYIDSTGFKRLLINKMGAKWVSFGKYLKMKAAVVFQTEDTENYNLYTTATAMDYGWMFNLPVWGRHGNGYIFDSDYINADQAKLEIEKTLKREVNIGKQFNFDPGYCEDVWIRNCCAIGISGSFVEPMEASSIGTTIQQSFLLMHKLPNYNEKTIESYNKSFRDIMQNIRDIVFLHYITKKRNTSFWKDIAKVEVPDTLAQKLELWEHKLPIKEDLTEKSQYILFGEDSYTTIMHGLKLFNVDSIKKEYYSMYDFIDKEAENILKRERDYEKTTQTVSHKKFIETVRNRDLSKP